MLLNRQMPMMHVTFTKTPTNLTYSGYSDEVDKAGNAEQLVALDRAVHMVCCKTRLGADGEHAARNMTPATKDT